MHGRSLDLCCLLGGAAGGSWAAEWGGSSIVLPAARATVRSAALATGTRGERGWFLLFANVIASHGQTLMFKITPVVCDRVKGYSGDEYSWLAGF